MEYGGTKVPDKRPTKLWVERQPDGLWGVLSDTRPDKPLGFTNEAAARDYAHWLADYHKAEVVECPQSKSSS